MIPRRTRAVHSLLAALALLAGTALNLTAAPPSGTKWITAWTGSAQGPYPSGNATAQPNLSRVFPPPESGARDQSFRLIVKPGVWGGQTRVRLSNAFGTRPVTFDGVFVAMQMSGAALAHGTNRPVAFAGKSSVTIAPGEAAWSDAVLLPFVRDAAGVELAGRKLAVTIHVAGESGPMTWHAKALQTSYVTAPGAGAKGDEETEVAFPFSTTSWYFLDAMDMTAPADSRLVVAFGDSITDGTDSTLNGDDRWPDVLARRLPAVSHTYVVNAGIGGNQVVGPAAYSAQKPSSGGPSALQRLDRDVLSLSGVSAVIWLEGINDFGKSVNASAATVEAGMREGVKRIRAAIPGVRVIGATLTSALGSTNAAHGSAEEDAVRKELNEFIRSGGVFDGVADFDKATTDPQTGAMRAEFVPDSTTGGPGDKLHPNRAGYLAMGMAVDIDGLKGKAKGSGR